MKGAPLSRYFVIRIRCCAVKNKNSDEARGTGVGNCRGRPLCLPEKTMQITTQQFNSSRFLRSVRLALETLMAIHRSAQ